jgi:hypothetical protein
MYWSRVLVCVTLLSMVPTACVPTGSFAVKSKKLTVLGTLTGQVAVGDESAGWSIQLNPVIMVDGTQIASLEIKSSDREKLQSLEDKFVQARGKLTVILGPEAVNPPVFEVSSIREHKEKNTRH